MNEPHLRWVRWDGWWSHDSSTTCLASVLVPAENGVVRASAEYGYEYYGEWYGGALRQRFTLLTKADGATQSVARPTRLPARWPPANGYDAWDFTPKLIALDADGTRYTADGDCIDAHDANGRPLWSVTLAFSEPPGYGGTTPTPPREIRWIETAPGCLYVLTATNTVACLSDNQGPATPFGLAEQRAFVALARDDPDASRLLARLDEETWTSVVETAYRAKVPGQAAFDAYFGGPDDDAARQRWYDHTSLATLKQLVLRTDALPADLFAILRLPALESLIVAEPGSQHYTQLDGRHAIGGFLLSRNHTAYLRKDRP